MKIWNKKINDLNDFIKKIGFVIKDSLIQIIQYKFEYINFYSIFNYYSYKIDINKNKNIIDFDKLNYCKHKTLNEDDNIYFVNIMMKLLLKQIQIIKYIFKMKNYLKQINIFYYKKFIKKIFQNILNIYVIV